MIWLLAGIVVVVISACRAANDCPDSDFKRFEIEQILRNMDREQAKACHKS